MTNVWNTNDIQTAFDMERAGMTHAAIARALNRTKLAVKSQLSRHRQMSLSPEQNGPWTMAQIKKLLDMQAAGLTLAEIARQLGRSRPSITGQLQRLRTIKDVPRYPLADIPSAHPLVRELFARARDRGLTNYDALGEACGLGRGQLRALGWTNPDIQTLSKIAATLGMTIALVEVPHGD